MSTKAVHFQPVQMTQMSFQPAAARPAFTGVPVSIYQPQRMHAYALQTTQDYCVRQKLHKLNTTFQLSMDNRLQGFALSRPTINLA